MRWRGAGRNNPFEGRPNGLVAPMSSDNKGFDGSTICRRVVDLFGEARRFTSPLVVDTQRAAFSEPPFAFPACRPVRPAFASVSSLLTNTMDHAGPPARVGILAQGRDHLSVLPMGR